MTLYEMVRLPKEERMEVINQQGSFIISDPEEPSNYYMVGDFFDQVRLNKASDRILEVVPFRSGSRFERMTGCIDLSKLV